MNLFNLFSETTHIEYQMANSNGSVSLSYLNNSLLLVLAMLFIGIALFITSVAFLIRWWQVQTAIMRMQQDISEMNERQREKSPSNDDTES
ncbi:MAG: hypothetical protein JWO99_391 [Candidatus Saccharibacteria bacterium]|nr:hypothetical protein [Candidatus Saccharibacteria bacterium]